MKKRMYIHKDSKGVKKMGEGNEKILATAIYVTSFFSAVLGPLIIWLIKKDESPFINYHGKEYFNFFISYTIYSLVAGILCIVLIGFLILPVVGLLAFIFTIVGAVKAFDGEAYRIPFIFRIIK